MAFPDDETAGHVGVPLPCVQIRLADVPEMGYKVDRGDPGEICIRGTSVSAGYFDDPERTKQSYRDGWLYTGDIGLFQPVLTTFNNCVTTNFGHCCK